jgi:hypothetical protein
MKRFSLAFSRAAGFRKPATFRDIAGLSGMTRPQRGTHRFMEEPVPALFPPEGAISGDLVIPIGPPAAPHAE